MAEPIGQWLWVVLSRLGIERAFRARHALSAWDRLVGDALAKVAQPLRLEGGMLWVAVKSSAWAQELQFQKATLLQRLNQEAGSDCFQEIRFVVRAQLPRRELRTEGAAAEHSRAVEALPELTEEEREALWHSVSAIQEPTLREAIYRAREASLRLEKGRLAAGWRRCRRCGEWHTESSALCFLCREQAR